MAVEYINPELGLDLVCQQSRQSLEGEKLGGLNSSGFSDSVWDFPRGAHRASLHRGTGSGRSPASTCRPGQNSVPLSTRAGLLAQVTKSRAKAGDVLSVRGNKPSPDLRIPTKPPLITPNVASDRAFKPLRAYHSCTNLKGGVIK
ncbi:hypothetical protein PSTG_04988 [Puccinia striiformis f. sp. tritici PST-78]|uniref:Uncharacterized protein n=1 Tax=Puccinia striiformis f. sp. tritici PST-78 TaxID=1165861 RepID=A0A0L0VRH2_9BASI|nr:hypothetical protein PSTG_04988 [Puccinia striiformis f. sp. tritici PST-78]